VAITVYWTSFAGKNSDISMASQFQHGLFFEPEPVLKHIVSERNKDVRYLKCPAVKDYYKNTFVIRSPIDLSFEIKRNEMDVRYCVTHNYDQEFFNNYVHERFNENPIPMISMEFCSYIFYSEKSILAEQLHPALSMHSSEVSRKTSIISGTFDISKWVRPFTYSFEVVDYKSPITIKRGDPLYYVRFNVKENVKLQRVMFDKDIKDISDACLTVKNFVQNNSMENNYNIIKPFLDFHKQKLFKNGKCPFSRWFK